MSNLVEHARQELRLLDEDPETTEGLLKCIQALADMGHSGGSASICIPLLNDLLQFRNLTDLTDNPSEWMNVSDFSTEPTWQSKRRADAFSKDGGITYYMLDEPKGRDWLGRRRRRVMHNSKPYRVAPAKTTSA